MSLAEVLLAIGMCVVVILSAMALSISALRSNEKTSDMLVAQAYATQVLNEFVYNVPASGDTFWTQTSFSSPYAQDSAQLGPTQFDANLYLFSLSGAPAGMLRCVVNVTWKSGQQGGAGQGLQVTEVSRLLYAH